MKRCAQCGREGVRGFRVIPPRKGTLPIAGSEFYTDPITVCTAEKACRKRWPKKAWDDE